MLQIPICLLRFYVEGVVYEELLLWIGHQKIEGSKGEVQNNQQEACSCTACFKYVVKQDVDEEWNLKH